MHTEPLLARVTRPHVTPDIVGANAQLSEDEQMSTVVQKMSGREGLHLNHSSPLRSEHQGFLCCMTVP